jgi:hypothetical protein
VAGQLEVLRPKRASAIVWGAIGFALGAAILGLLVWRFERQWSLEINVIALAVWGAIGGLCLGIATKRRVLALLLAGAVGFAASLATAAIPFYFDFEFGIVGSAIQGAIAGAVMGLALGYRWKALALAAAGSFAFAWSRVFWIGLYRSIGAIAGWMLARVIAFAVWGGVIGAAFGLVIDIIEQRSTTP